MPFHDYLVEMNFAPFASLPSPQEAITFTERFVKPTLEACRRLLAAGEILAGGPPLATTGLIFIARASSPEALEEMIVALPLWTRAQTRVVPLGTFDRRQRLTDDRLRKTKALLHSADTHVPAAPSR